ncbi:MAG TPA: Holliday junction resolvase RuvX [Bacillota bacterium]
MEERWMALDVGSKRIGVAISDPLGLIAQGIEVYQRKGGLEKDLAYLTELFRRHQAQRLLLGLPRHMDGREGPEAKGIRKFGRLLGARCGVEPVFWDERLTTTEAERMLVSADLSRAKRRKVIDEVAAVILLESFLRNRNT